MGGNALKHVGVERKDRAEFLRLTEQILARLSPLTSGKLAIVPYVRDKESFGDADILVSSAGLDMDQAPPIKRWQGNMSKWLRSVLTEFDVEEDGFYQNKPVYGFAFENLQVDLILIEDQYFDAALNYFAWNDLGNLMGRIAHKMGFKYGEHGLQYIVRTSDTHALATVDVTTDMELICKFLGYSPEWFAKGFDSIEEMWQFAMSSEYFNPEIYQLDNLNSKSKVRDRKRSSYTGFLDFIHPRHAKAMRAYPWSVDKRLKRVHHLFRAFEWFPEFQKLFDEAMRKAALAEMAKRKFSGDSVRDVTGLDGAELGAAMKYLRTRPWTKPETLMALDMDTIDELIHSDIRNRP